ncbi:MAG: DUF1778 domain-containing protein [Candidatus Competibacteraceae bacterium]
MSMANDVKAERINLRASKEAKDLMQHAADLLGTTLSAFILSQAYEAARRVVADQEILWLSNRDRDRFLTALENPPVPNEALCELLRTVPGRP